MVVIVRNIIKSRFRVQKFQKQSRKKFKIVRSLSAELAISIEWFNHISPTRIKNLVIFELAKSYVGSYVGHPSFPDRASMQKENVRLFHCSHPQTKIFFQSSFYRHRVYNYSRSWPETLISTS